MTGMGDLLREYERVRFPPARRLDVQAESPRAARDRALKWIQSRAHETPGEELLLVVERGCRPGATPGVVEVELRKLLDEMQGRLIEWWEPFTPGTLALRIAFDPRFHRPAAPASEPRGDGRTGATAGAARPDPAADIPPDLLDLARHAAELRRDREGLSLHLATVVLREVWNESQVLAMDRRLTFRAALEAVAARERERVDSGCSSEGP